MGGGVPYIVLNTIGSLMAEERSASQLKCVGPNQKARGELIFVELNYMRLMTWYWSCTAPLGCICILMIARAGFQQEELQRLILDLD